jgi:hypothetical protein
MSALGSLTFERPQCRYCEEDATGGFCFNTVLSFVDGKPVHICPKCVRWAFDEVLTRCPRQHKRSGEDG